MQRYSPETSGGRASDETRLGFEAWQRQWPAIQRGIDELVADLSKESRT